jgi:hypothetical protein
MAPMRLFLESHGLKEKHAVNSRGVKDGSHEKRDVAMSNG